MRYISDPKGAIGRWESDLGDTYPHDWVPALRAISEADFILEYLDLLQEGLDHYDPEFTEAAIQVAHERLTEDQRKKIEVEVTLSQ